MDIWFESLSIFEKVYWVIACVASVIFVGLLVLTLLGGESDGIDGDVDAEIESDTGIEFQFLSFKNLVGFFTIFGWSGIAMLEADFSKILVVVISIICGLIMMFAMASLFYYLAKLQSSGTLKLANAINQVGEIYLTVGANRSKIGKVSITVQGTLRELDALTEELTDLKQGNVVRVTKVTDNGILIVESLNK